MTVPDHDSPDPRVHTDAIAERLQALVDHLRHDVTEVDDPRAQALFETAAEVLGGLRKAFVDYGQRNEKAWTG